ncbi:hypothetical protein CHARACLAT_033314 [Characodon lateralis]|uniref:Uncharacterized protein n=1 Tax=Characodon lateralis TaxID=208331 RepID=A0ABU7D2R7_9TELE|nr:hypothetical protein [Characodon lateralis]
MYLYISCKSFLCSTTAVCKRIQYSASLGLQLAVLVPFSAFLKDQSSRCSQHVALDGDCSSLRALRMDTYTNIQLFAVSSRFLPLILLPSCRENAHSSSLTWYQINLTMETASLTCVRRLHGLKKHFYTFITHTAFVSSLASYGCNCCVSHLQWNMCCKVLL